MGHQQGRPGTGSNESLYRGIVQILSFEISWSLNPPTKLCLLNTEVWWQRRCYIKWLPLVWEERKTGENLMQIHESTLLASETVLERNSADLSVNTSYWLNSQETNFRYHGDALEFISFLNNGVLSPYSLIENKMLKRKSHMCSDLGNKWFTWHSPGFLFVQN